MSRKNGLIFSGIGLLAVIALLVIVLIIPEKPEILPDTSYELEVIISKPRADITSVAIDNDTGAYRITQEGDGNWGIDELGDLSYSSSIYNYVGNAACEIIAKKVVNESAENLADYGLETPFATAAITFADEETLLLKIGNQVTGSTDRYISVDEENKVYTIEEMSVDGFLKPYTDYVSKTLVNPLGEGEITIFDKIVLDGTVREEPIVIDKNTQERPESQAEQMIFSQYIITSPKRAYVYEQRAKNFIAEIPGLVAKSVVMINPTDSDLSTFGLLEPFSSLEYTQEGRSVTIKLGNKDPNGDYYISISDLPNVVYTIAPQEVPFDTLQYHDMINLTMISVPIFDVSELYIKTRDKEYSFDITNTPDQQLTASYNGNELDIEIFKNLYKLTLINVGETPVYELPTDEAVVEVRFKYTDSSLPDEVIEYIPVGDRQFAILVNGRCDFSLSEIYIDTLEQSVEKCINGEEFVAQW